MTNDEFILQRLRQEKRLHFGLCVVCAIAAAGAIAMGMAAVAIGKPEGLLVFATAALGFGVSTHTARGRSQVFGNAIEEIGGDTHDLDKWHDFSKPTMSALGDVQRPAKTYWQMALAYGICGLAMLPGGALIVFFAEDEPVLIAAGVVMLAMGAGLVFLAAQALANWRIAQKLESAG